MRYTLAALAFAAAVKASPVANPQAVTASIAPSSSPPPGCSASVSGSFAIAVMNITTSTAPARRQVSQQTDQPSMTMGLVSMVNDGQIQGGLQTMMVLPIAQSSNAQAITTMAPVTDYIDGQPQAPKVTTAPAVSQSSDEQTAASTAAPVSQLPDNQPQISTSISSLSTTPPALGPSSATAAPASSRSATSGSVLVACATNGTLELTLADGILHDSHGRIGYIASNYQFQFDNPPQAGAIYTAGFSVCSNGSLALGGSTVFYQCLSGSFYNLYNENVAAQCSPVTINTLTLKTCA